MNATSPPVSMARLIHRRSATRPPGQPSVGDRPDVRACYRQARPHAASPLFRDTSAHLVYVGEPDFARRDQIDKAKTALESVCSDLQVALLEGEVEASLRAYKQVQDLDLLLMGAYGHSRIRHLLVGSTTTEMIRHASMPVLILR